ncbi:MAG: hypothetical protein E2584_06585, partial [Microbacterium sp.]|nr:hypothetical protein [Microbacterium sp.]
MRIELVKRPQPSKLFSALSPLLALTLTLVFGGLAFALMGKDPLHALYVFFVEPLFDIWSWHELLVKAAPLILIAVGLCICFLSNNWNIGAEGQFIAGAIAGSVLPVMFPDLQSWVILPLMMLMGMAGGMAYASIPALLKVRFNTNEILTSLMLVYVAQLFLDWLVRGPWRNPEGYNFPETRQFNDSAILPEIWSASGRAHWGFIFALVAAVVVWFLLKHTLKGFEVKVWHGVYAPKGTPPEAVAKFNEALLVAMKDPPYTQKMAELGAELVPESKQTPQGLQTSLQS